MLALQEADSATKADIPQHYPSRLDRITLILTGTKKAHEIGDEVRYYMQKFAHYSTFHSKQDANLHFL